MISPTGFFSLLARPSVQSAGTLTKAGQVWYRCVEQSLTVPLALDSAARTLSWAVAKKLWRVPAFVTSASATRNP